jgi:hypothetical protein
MGSFARQSAWCLGEVLPSGEGRHGLRALGEVLPSVGEVLPSEEVLLPSGE